MLSEVAGSPLRAARQDAVNALRELGRRARERGVTTFVVLDTHWLSNFGYHISANPRHRGAFTSHEAPHVIQDLASRPCRLHIGDPNRHTEFAPADVGKNSHALADLFVRGARKAQPQPAL